jgi:hypothetical protein
LNPASSSSSWLQHILPMAAQSADEEDELQVKCAVDGSKQVGCICGWAFPFSQLWLLL